MLCTTRHATRSGANMVVFESRDALCCKRYRILPKSSEVSASHRIFRALRKPGWRPQEARVGPHGPASITPSVLDATSTSPHDSPAELSIYRETLHGVYQSTNDCKFNLKAQTGFSFLAGKVADAREFYPTKSSSVCYVYSVCTGPYVFLPFV
jgi:hypothetical protein